MEDLKGKKVAILVTDGFEQSEFQKPYDALKEASAEIDVVSLKSGSIKGWNEGDWGNEVQVDKVVSEVSASDYDALVLPGGVINPDKLRNDEQAVSFAKQFMTDKKPVAAICHGPWTLVETGALEGRTLTSYSSIKTDLKNAGARWTDEAVVVDNGLVTSRNPDDLPAFCDKMVEEIGEGVHA